MDLSQSEAKTKILIIEDDNYIREMYRDEFKRNGFEVFTSATGEEGLKSLEQNLVDLVLLDILLPGVNGLEVLKRIKEEPKTSKIKVVLLTNLGQEATIKEGFKMGALGYLIKSAYNPDQIIQEVKSFLAST